LLPPGVILPYGASAAPLGFLLCDGSAYSRITYSSLFAVIGDTYGAPNLSTFNVPDMRQRVPYYGNEIGISGGTASVTLSTGNLPAHDHTGTTSSDGSHTHSITDPGHSHTSKIAVDDNNGTNVEGQGPAGDSYENVRNGMSTTTSTTDISVNSGGSHTHTFTTSSVGSGTAFSVLNPFLSLRFIIKY
jgi:microcystin-dependent protein